MAGCIAWCTACERSAEQPSQPSAPVTPPPVDASAAPTSPTQQITPAIRFEDVTAASGIDMTMTCGRVPATEILEVNGGGLALIDYDNDGDLDLFVANGATLENPEDGPGCKLFENLAINTAAAASASASAAADTRPLSPGAGISFRDVTQQANITIRRWANAAAVGDYNGDGFDDIYITCYGPSILLHNNGDGTFSDVTQRAFGEAAAGSANNVPQWSTSAAFGDLDNDGDLDLYVCNYLEFSIQQPPPRATFKGVEVMGGPHGMTPQHDVLFENLSDSQSSTGDHSSPLFRDVTEISGCRDVRPSFGLNVVIIDLDHDGWQDITVANDSMPDFLFHNLALRSDSAGAEAPGSGADRSRLRFAEVGVISGLAANADGSNQASMGLAIADVDANGLPDKFTTVFSSDVNALHLNVSRVPSSSNSGVAREQPSVHLLFEDRAQQYGLAMISRPYLGWSAGFYDFDHDGDEDLFMVNGHVYPQATRELMDSQFEQTPLLFMRDGTPGTGSPPGRFKPVNAQMAGDWLAQRHRDRNAVFADLDHDGDIDIIIGELNGPIRVLRSLANDGSHPANDSWLCVWLKDDRTGSGNHRGLGARMELMLADDASEVAASSGAAPNSTGVAQQTRWLFTGGGFQSSGAPYVHFGVPAAWRGKPLRLRVIWPDGMEQAIEPITTGRHHIIMRQQPN